MYLPQKTQNLNGSRRLLACEEIGGHDIKPFQCEHYTFFSVGKVYEENLQEFPKEGQ